MTRKDFELIAKVLRTADEVADQETIEALAEMFANELQGTNPNFNRGLFIAKATATESATRALRELIGA